MRHSTRRAALRRLWQMITICTVLSTLLAGPVAAQEPPVFLPVVQGDPTSQAGPQEAIREMDTFRVTSPSDDLLAAIEEFKVGDPDASFSFFNGHVDSFATRPKPTIPDYARDILNELGLTLTDQMPELLPDPAPFDSTKYLQNLDSSPELRFPWLPEPANNTPTTPETEELDTNPNDPDPTTPPNERRLLTPPILEPRDDWQQPSDRVMALLNPAYEPVLAAFLRLHPAVFELPAVQIPGDILMLEPKTVRAGRYFRLVKFSQMYGQYPVLGADLSALFDVNFNVVGLSRMIVDPSKIEIDLTNNVERDRALAIALQAAEHATGKQQGLWSPVSLTLGVDLLRRHLVWEVNLIIPSAPEYDLTIVIDARTGAVLVVIDNVDAFYADGMNGELDRIAFVPSHDGEDHEPEPVGYGAMTEAEAQAASPDAVTYTDARVRRWAYTDGNVTEPFQVTTSNVYVRDDNTLTHDFFYSANDQRTNGSLVACADQSNKTTWPSAAWGSFSSSTFIRHTHRSDRDFSLWSPGEASGTFSESHNYFWSRAFFQWLKPALKELGVLPSSASNYPRVLMVTNACIDDIGYASSAGLEVTVQHNEGESSRKIRIADACRSGNPNCAASDYSDGKGGHYSSCDGSACMATPSIIHHEINHYILAQFFGVGSGVDCSVGNQLKFLHEGTLGSVVPQAFWHHYYGVGYAPSDTDRLFTMDEVRGRVHVSNATRLDIGDWLCVNNTTVTPGNKGPYNAGRVPGQVLWKFYHGIEYNGSVPGSLWRPNTDTDFLILVYWAADLVAGSTYKDRYEVANRVMEILDKHSNWTPAAKADYCAEWAKHELDNWINPDYCS